MAEHERNITLHIIIRLLGMLKIVGTEDYISEVSFHDKSPKKSAGRKKHLPPLLIQCVEQLIQYFNGERRQFELPIHQPGTAFQQGVWNELVTIPYAKTISYLELARRTGDTKATRAVANANGKNNVAIIVPCHRVIGSNRELSWLWRRIMEKEMVIGT